MLNEQKSFLTRQRHVALVFVMAFALPAFSLTGCGSSSQSDGSAELWEANTLDDADGSYSVSNGSLAPEFGTVYEGTQSIRAEYDGVGSNGYARVQHAVSVSAGDTIEYGTALYLPEGFFQQQQGQVALMRWDDFALNPDFAQQGGLVLRSDGKLVLVLQDLSNDSYLELTEQAVVPEGQWMEIAVIQKLSANSGEALNQVWVDGDLVSESSNANLVSSAISNVRYGIVSIAEGNQTNKLTLFMDSLFCECSSR